MTNNPRKRPRSVTPESVQNINKTTLNNKSQISNSTTQSTILVQGSTGNAGVLLPFWNEYTQEESRKWWLPKRTDCVNLDSSLWNRSLRKMGLSSWYSVRMSVPRVARLENSQKTCSQSSQYLWQDIMGCVLLPTVEEDEKLLKHQKKKSGKIPSGKIRRIRLFPTQEEKLKLKR